MAKKSNYDGYATVRGSPVKGASEAFKVNYEGMRTAYETYKRDGQPNSATTQKQIDKGSEKAIGRVQDAGRASDAERQREFNRPSMSKKWTE